MSSLRFLTIAMLAAGAGPVWADAPLPGGQYDGRADVAFRSHAIGNVNASGTALDRLAIEVVEDRCRTTTGVMKTVAGDLAFADVPIDAAGTFSSQRITHPVPGTTATTTIEGSFSDGGWRLRGSARRVITYRSGVVRRCDTGPVVFHASPPIFEGSTSQGQPVTMWVTGDGATVTDVSATAAMTCWGDDHAPYSRTITVPSAPLGTAGFYWFRDRREQDGTDYSVSGKVKGAAITGEINAEEVLRDPSLLPEEWPNNGINCEAEPPPGKQLSVEYTATRRYPDDEVRWTASTTERATPRTVARAASANRPFDGRYLGRTWNSKPAPVELRVTADGRRLRGEFEFANSCKGGPMSFYARGITIRRNGRFSFRRVWDHPQTDFRTIDVWRGRVSSDGLRISGTATAMIRWEDGSWCRMSNVRYSASVPWYSGTTAQGFPFDLAGHTERGQPPIRTALTMRCPSGAYVSQTIGDLTDLLARTTRANRPKVLNINWRSLGATATGKIFGKQGGCEGTTRFTAKRIYPQDVL